MIDCGYTQAETGPRIPVDIDPLYQGQGHGWDDGHQTAIIYLRPTSGSDRPVRDLEQSRRRVSGRST